MTGDEPDVDEAGADGRRLRADLAALAASAPPVADWPGRVRRVVVRRRRRRTAVLSAGAVLVLLAGGVALAAGGRGSDRLVAAPPSESDVPEPSRTPTPGAPVRPVDCGGAPLLDILTPAAYGPDVKDAITIALAPACATVRVGQPLAIAVAAAGNVVTPRLESVTIAGETTGAPLPCPPFAAPIRPTPQPGVFNDVVRHTYTSPGTDVVTVTVDSGCTNYEATATREVTITVLPANGADAPPSEAPAGPGPAMSGSSPKPSAAPSPSAGEPTYGTQTIVLALQPGERPVAGQPWSVTVTADGQADRPPFLQVRFDDEGPGFIVGSCAAPTDPSPPPARPQHAEQTLEHTFDTPGPHRVRARADAACSYYRGETMREFVVDVAPTPTPDPSPAGGPSAGPSSAGS